MTFLSCCISLNVKIEDNSEPNVLWLTLNMLLPGGQQLKI